VPSPFRCTSKSTPPGCLSDSWTRWRWPIIPAKQKSIRRFDSLVRRLGGPPSGVLNLPRPGGCMAPGCPIARCCVSAQGRYGRNFDRRSSLWPKPAWLPIRTFSGVARLDYGSRTHLRPPVPVKLRIHFGVPAAVRSKLSELMDRSGSSWRRLQPAGSRLFSTLVPARPTCASMKAPR